MTARIITGSKQQIAEQVAGLEGQVREAIVFVEELTAPALPAADIFAEMERLTVRQTGVDDSREAIYQGGVGE